MDIADTESPISSKAQRTASGALPYDRELHAPPHLCLFNAPRLRVSEFDRSKLPKGHKTGGRQKGTPNTATAAKAAAIEASGLTPLDYMLSVLRSTINAGDGYNTIDGTSWQELFARRL